MSSFNLPERLALMACGVRRQNLAFQRYPAKIRASLINASYLAHFLPTPPPFFAFSCDCFPPETITRVHSHPCIALHGCIHGPLQLVLPGGPEILGAGSFCVLAPEVRHHSQNPGAQTAASFNFLIDAQHYPSGPKSWGFANCCRDLNRLVRGMHRFDCARDTQMRAIFWQLADRLLAETPGKRGTLAALLWALTGLIAERLESPSPAEPQTNDAAQQIRRLLLARVQDRLSLDAIAQEVGMSVSNAEAVFHRAFGCPIMSYFNQLKVWQAKHWLTDPDVTVDQVGRHLGFSSLTYFSRVFRRYTGESPTDFRNRNKIRK